MNRIEEIVQAHAHLLPTQGPLDVFVHHNTLHPFESLPFLKAIESAAEIYGACPYLPERHYLEAFSKGRINDLDLADAVAESDPKFDTRAEGWPEQVRAYLISASEIRGRTQVQWSLLEEDGLDGRMPPFGSRRWDGAVAREVAKISRLDPAERSRLMANLVKRHPYWSEADELVERELRDLVRAANSSMHSIALRALWLVCLAKAWNLVELTEGVSGESSRVDDVIERSSYKELALPVVTKLVGAFIDRGLGGWSLPRREEGFFKAALGYLSFKGGLRPWILEGIESIAARALSLTPVQVIEEQLLMARVPEEGWDNELRGELLELKGWSGFMHLIGHQPDLSPYKGSSNHRALIEFLAIKMLVYGYGKMRVAHLHEGPTTNVQQESSISREQALVDRLYTSAFHIFRWAQVLGRPATELEKFSIAQGSVMYELFSTWTANDRERVWHIAYERNFERRTYEAFLKKAREPQGEKVPVTFQIACCLDDREESFRRHLEEMGEHIATYGTAGFFGVDVSFEELGKPAAAYCPVIINPRHHVSEVARPEQAERLGRAEAIEGVLEGVMSHTARFSPRFISGWLEGLTGIVTFLPMVLRTLYPRISHIFNQRILDPLHEGTTDVLYSRDASEVQDKEESSTAMYHGYTPQEMCDRVAGLLRSMGLVKDFAPLITVIGHGSSSKNNPFKSAYDCGACGGRPGRVNARVFALMANRADVRALLRETKGINLPNGTVFLGAYHDTCNDSVIFFDTEQVPTSHGTLFEELRSTIHAVRARNADERCRRFAYADRRSPQNALAYVEGRAQHIAEPRPEYGHATNAICIVGRREQTRGLFFDRRAFLTSYDPEIDETGELLAGLMRAVVPVCMGINLEYFFSTIDNDVYGAGSKLPINIASLVGVITGYASDLRTGLPAQMVEIHEPVRMVMIIDAPIVRVQALLTELPQVAKLVENEWFFLSVFDATTGTLSRIRSADRVVPWRSSSEAVSEVWGEEILTASSSDNLPFVVIH